jgi:hypothetical protein
MASIATIRVQVDYAKTAGELQATPAKVRRVLRGAMDKVGRLSARRVKANLASQRRTRQYERSTGHIVRTYGETVVTVIGARRGFKIDDPTYGPVNPAKYNRIVENGRQASAGVPWLVLRFPTLAKLTRFLDRHPKRMASSGPVKGRRGSTGNALYARMRRRYGPRIASRVHLNSRGTGYVFFIRKANAATGTQPVGRDADNTNRDAERLVAAELADKLGGR